MSSDEIITNLSPMSTVSMLQHKKNESYPQTLLRPCRTITGISAILLPYKDDYSVDWAGFEQSLDRTIAAGLIPAVNMDTGYVSLIDEATRREVLQRTSAITSGLEFVAGVYVDDSPGDELNTDTYRHKTEQVEAASGTPILFQSFGLHELPEDEIAPAYEAMTRSCDKFIFFELAKDFAPFGRIYSLKTYERLMLITNVIGAKHSSLNRETEWRRIDLRNRIRPDFKVFTGNDLAIDMVMYGSDYLLGLSAFAPDAFARRDAMWAAGDPRFFKLNDVLQYLGAFAFRPPVPAYKHSAAMFLKIQNQIACSVNHPDSPQRPETDTEVLSVIANDLRQLLEESNQ